MLKKQKKSERKFLLIGKDTPFSYNEAFKSLRTNLKFLALGKSCKKIILTSAIPTEGKSSVCINLATSLVEGGSRVLLMDCDLRKPFLHRYLKLHRAQKGLTSLLSGSSTEECILKLDSGLHVLLSDAIPPNPAELLGSEQMKDMIDALAQSYDYILFDTPPVSVVTDAAVLSQFVDGVIFVIRQNHATFEEAQLAKKNLDTVHARILGAVLNDFDTKSADRESGYYYSYNYDYSHES